MKNIIKYVLSFFAVTLSASVLSQASQTLPSGSFLNFKAQVTAPATSPTINSTHAISSNDFVQWTSYFQSKLTSPFQSDGVITLPENFKWQERSVFAPANTVLRWNVGGVWQNDEPSTGIVISQVGWKTDPLIKIKVQPAVSGLVNFKGTGDGYRVIAYKDYLYVVNHHMAWNYLNCRVAETSAPCLGFQNSGLSIPSNNNTNLSSNASPLVTPNRSIEHLNIASGELFVYVANANTVKVVCANLDTLKSCMNEVTMDSNTQANEEASNPIGSIGSKYYALSSTGKLLCFDTSTKSPCAGQPFNFGLSGTNSLSMSTIMDNKIIFAANNGKLQCIDSITHLPCSGWSQANALQVGYQVFPVVYPNGTSKGVCATSGCRLLDGSSFTPSNNYTSYLIDNLFFTANGMYAEANTFGSRVYQSRTGYKRNYATCFDFSTDSVCPNFPLQHPDTQPNIYSINKDLVRRDCMWALGDEALAKSFNPLTGGDCPLSPAIPATLLLAVEPSNNYRCDPSMARVDRWGKVRFSPALTWGGNGLTSVKAKIMDWAGTVLPAQYNPNRDFVSGSHELSIADIPYARYPKLKIELTIVTGTQAITTEVGFDVTWDGDPAQLCFKTQAPPVDVCGLGASVTLQNKAVHMANYSETLSANTGFTPNVLQSGWGPRTSATTLSEKITGLDITQVLQTRFNMNNYTGDLWQFPFSSTGVLAGAPTSSASNILNIRTFYTSTPSAASGTPILTTLSYNALSAVQKTALNQTLYGTTDRLGEQRVNYIMGDRSSEAASFDITPLDKLRKRTRNLLGPVIDSSPTVLMRSPLAGYNDLQFPYYNAFKTSTNRTDKLALYAGNDGFLHGYKVSPTSGLTQVFSYMPSSVLKRIQTYTDTSLSGVVLNPYRLDNTPMVADVNLATSVSGDQWRTVVVGNHGRGGRGVYALDITTGKPDSVLFEYDNTSHTDLADLGYMHGQPPSDMVTGADQIVRIGSDARWAYIAGNGINSNDGNPAASGTGKAVLYIFYMNAAANGANQRWKRIPVNTTGALDADLDFGNGLGTPRPVDTNNDGIVDLIYAGDKKGNLWRFNVRDLNNVVVTKIYKTPSAVAVTGQQPVAQSINNAPVVQQFGGAGQCPTNQAANCWMVVFGTGDDINPLSFTSTSSGSTSRQSFYGVFDKGEIGVNALVTDTNLVEQTMGTSDSQVGSVRTISNTTVDYTGGKRGWRMQLSAGEHTSASPELQANGSVMFATSRPAGMAVTSCAPGMGWLTQLNMTRGTGKNNAFKNTANNSTGSSVVINTGTGTYAIPNTLLGRTLNSRTHKLLTSGTVGGVGTGTGLDVSTITQSTDIMVGRMSWREVFSAPR